MAVQSDVERFVRFCESEFGKKVMQAEAEYIQNELKGCSSILDVGCGIGSFEERLPELNITGLDSSPEMLEEAGKRSNKPFVLGDAEHLDFEDGLFDAVFFVAALEFLSDYRKAIQEACRVTKPDGKLVAMMLNPESEYFHEHIQKENSYFRRIKHSNIREIRDCIAMIYHNITKEEYFLGIKGRQVFNASDRKFAALYVVVGEKA